MSSEDVDQELDRLDNNLNGLWEGRIPELETKIDRLQKRINDLDGKIADIDGRIEAIELSMAKPARDEAEASGGDEGD